MCALRIRPGQNSLRVAIGKGCGLIKDLCVEEGRNNIECTAVEDHRGVIQDVFDFFDGPVLLRGHKRPRVAERADMSSPSGGPT